MKGAPVAASSESVAAALSLGGAHACEQQIRLLRSGDKAAVERAARTLKKIAEADAKTLYPWRKALLKEALRATDVRVQWNLSIVLGKLPLQGADKALAVDLMFERLQDQSGLNRTMAMQALMDLSANDARLRSRVLPVIQEALEAGTPAVRARARKLLGVGRSPSRTGC
jgi:hypothetical protein